MLFKKTQNAQDIEFDTLKSKKYPTFDLIRDIYIEDKEESERYFIEN